MVDVWGTKSSWYRCFSWPSLVWSPKNWSFPIWVFPKIGVPQKWMVYDGKHYQNGWFGGKTHHFRKHPYEYHPEVSLMILVVDPTEEKDWVFALSVWKDLKSACWACWICQGILPNLWVFKFVPPSNNWSGLKCSNTDCLHQLIRIFTFTTDGGSFCSEMFFQIAVRNGLFGNFKTSLSWCTMYNSWLTEIRLEVCCFFPRTFATVHNFFWWGHLVDVAQTSGILGCQAWSLDNMFRISWDDDFVAIYKQI